MKKLVEKSEWIDWCRYDYELSKVRERINDLIEKYGENAKLDITSDDYGSVDFHISYSRLETDTEYEVRTNNEKKNIEQDILRKQALSKLTPEDIKALGIRI